MTGKAGAELTVRHVDVVHPDSATVDRDRLLRITAGRISAVEPDPGSPVGVDEVNATGRSAVPGLIDCHVHLNVLSTDLGSVADQSPTYVAARAGVEPRRMLGRGFTTVRDAGGVDFGLAAAVEEGLFPGPRVFFCGRALSQTGGHGDLRPAGRDVHDPDPAAPVLGVVCDGVIEVRPAAREQPRRGAHHLKLVVSGGCASPTDRIDSLQFSEEELRAVVEEARAANLYCAGHAYTAAAVNRALRLGVRTIEHGNLLDDSSIELFLEHDAYLVPTLITYVEQVQDAPRLRIDPAQVTKLASVVDQGFSALQAADRAGVRIAFGTDLLGATQERQSEEFALRARVQEPAAVLRSATTVAADLLGRSGDLGVLRPGATGDLVLARADPLRDISVLAEPGTGVTAVVKDGLLFAARPGDLVGRQFRAPAPPAASRRPRATRRTPCRSPDRSPARRPHWEQAGRAYFSAARGPGWSVVAPGFLSR